MRKRGQDQCRIYRTAPSLAIDTLQRETYIDQLQLRRLKKRKLQLKDAIAHLESMLIPDMDA